MSEVPSLEALVQRHDPARFTILGVNTDQVGEIVKRKLKEAGIGWPNILVGKRESPLLDAWGVLAFPSLYLIDAKGTIRAVDPRGEEIERAVSALLHP